MIGKLAYIDKEDAYYCDREFLVGSLWEMNDINIWEDNEYAWGRAVFINALPLNYTSNRPDIGEMEWSAGDSTIFHAVKFEILEETGE